MVTVLFIVILSLKGKMNMKQRRESEVKTKDRKHGNSMLFLRAKLIE